MRVSSTSSGRLMNIKAVCIGKAGKEAMRRMLRNGVRGVEFIDADSGRETVCQALRYTDVALILAGTGEGEAEAFARLAKEHGTFTVKIVTEPFESDNIWWSNPNTYSGKADIACAAHLNQSPIGELQPRQSLSARKLAAQRIRRGIRGAADLIALFTLPTTINLDFAEIKGRLQFSARAYMGAGAASGEGRAVKAAKQALRDPPCETIIDGARCVIISVTGPSDMTMYEIHEAVRQIWQAFDPDGMADIDNLYCGVNTDDTMGDCVRVAFIAAGSG